MCAAPSSALLTGDRWRVDTDAGRAAPCCGAIAVGRDNKEPLELFPRRHESDEKWWVAAKVHPRLPQLRELSASAGRLPERILPVGRGFRRCVETRWSAVDWAAQTCHADRQNMCAWCWGSSSAVQRYWRSVNFIALQSDVRSQPNDRNALCGLKIAPDRACAVSCVRTEC